MLKKILTQATYLLYADMRVDLKSYSYDYAKNIFKLNNIEYNDKDVIYYENIKIADVRQIISYAIQSSYSGVKIFIIDINGAGFEALNAMLKIIEEPPKNTYFLLLSKNLKLPKTILSRCIKINVIPKQIDVDSKIYEFFDGNEKYINEYLKENIDLKNYEINEIDDVDILNLKDDNIYTKIKYEMIIKYICTELKYESNYNKLLFISKIQNIFTDRIELKKFLSKILIKNNDISHNKYEYLVNLKNTLDNNVSVKYLIYIFFVILLDI